MTQTAHISIRWTGPLAALFVGFLTVVLYVFANLANRNRLAIAIPDEKAVALGLLAQKFTGPGYFHAGSWTTNAPGQIHGEGVFIATADAKTQLSRVARERQLDPKTSNNLDRLIERLSEPPQSRAVGVSEVNVLRLNLALDGQIVRSEGSGASPRQTR